MRSSARRTRAVALSLIISAVVRPTLDFVPMHVFDAPVAGSGKTRLVELACILASGHEPSVMSQGESREELEKRLGAMMLLRGDRLIAIDNCEKPLEGDLLNSALTSSMLSVRILESK